MREEGWQRRLTYIGKPYRMYLRWSSACDLKASRLEGHQAIWTEDMVFLGQQKSETECGGGSWTAGSWTPAMAGKASHVGDLGLTAPGDGGDAATGDGGGGGDTRLAYAAIGGSIGERWVWVREVFFPPDFSSERRVGGLIDLFSSGFPIDAYAGVPLADFSAVSARDNVRRVGCFLAGGMEDEKKLGGRWEG